MNDTKDRLRRVMVESLRLDLAPEAIPDTDLRNKVGIDSVMGLEFLIWVENEFGIQIKDEDLSVHLVDSLDTLAAYVDERVAETAVARD
ncbi:acyl carrier protein [Streptomyces sp. NPDC048664]|uniref:acyl carrier protein n=1 Tax=Streptomyces sp. NPDC048664 TaxID=3154505 RepID=UPI00341F3013